MMMISSNNNVMALKFAVDILGPAEDESSTPLSGPNSHLYTKNIKIQRADCCEQTTSKTL